MLLLKKSATAKCCSVGCWQNSLLFANYPWWSARLLLRLPTSAT